MDGLNTTYEWVMLILLIIAVAGIYLRGPWR